jgi:hypothetical protein
VSIRRLCAVSDPSKTRAEGLTLVGRSASALCGFFAFDTGVDLVKGATILAARLSEANRRRQEQLEWSPEHARRDDDLRCVTCGGAIADILASLGSLRCHDCRSGQPQQ